MRQRNLLGIALLFVLTLVLSACQPIEEFAKEAANKQVIQRLIKEVKNRENPAAVQELIAPDYRHHFQFPGEELPTGLAGTARVGEIFGLAFPEIMVTNDLLIAEGDFVLERSSVEALHGGDFLGIPATNQTVRWTENHLYRLKDGLIIEHWPELDMLGVVAQIGGFSRAE